MPGGLFARIVNAEVAPAALSQRQIALLAPAARIAVAWGPIFEPEDDAAAVGSLAGTKPPNIGIPNGRARLERRKRAVGNPGCWHRFGPAFVATPRLPHGNPWLPNGYPDR